MYFVFLKPCIPSSPPFLAGHSVSWPALAWEAASTLEKKKAAFRIEEAFSELERIPLLTF
jgi:hypothetical protein